MVVILRTLFLRDLRDNWVFPRLVYLATKQAVDRNVRRLCRLLIFWPRDRIVQLFVTFRDERGLVEIVLALLAVAAALLRAIALLIFAVGLLYISVSNL